MRVMGFKPKCESCGGTLGSYDYFAKARCCRSCGRWDAPLEEEPPVAEAIVALLVFLALVTIILVGRALGL